MKKKKKNKIMKKSSKTDFLPVSTTRLLEAARVLLVVQRIYHTSNKSNPTKNNQLNLHIF